jgi:plastocyanin
MKSRLFAAVSRFACAVCLLVGTSTFAANTDVTWDFTVSPSTVNLNVGDTVTFNGNLSFHPPSFANASFAPTGNPLVTSGSSFVQSFPSAGTFYFVCANHNSMRLTVTVTSVCAPPANPAVMDIDGNGQVDAATDGLLLVRYLIGLRGDGLIGGAVGVCPGRATASSIESYLAARVVP